MKKFKKLLLLSIMAGLALTGCGGDESGSSSDSSGSGDSSDSSEETVYELVLLPNDGGEINKGKEAFVTEVNKALEPFNARMEYTIVDDYSVASEALISGQADMVSDSGATYVTSRLANDDIEVLATYAPEGDLELAGYPSYLGVNTANAGDFEGLTEKKDILDQFVGNSFAFVSATSTSGRVVPSTVFWDTYGPDGSGDVEEKSNIFESTIDDGGIFSEVQFAGSHPAVIELLANNRVYGGAFCCDYADAEVEAGNIEIVYEEQVPGDPIWYNGANMDEEHVQAILDHITQLTPENAAEGLFQAAGVEADEADEYYLQENERFVEVDAEYYDYIENMLADEQ